MKNRKRAYIYLSWAFMTALLISCSALNELANIQKPKLSIDDVSVTRLSLSDIELTFDVQVENPNPMAVTFNDYAYDFKLNEQTFVSGNQSSQTEVAASSSSIIKVPVQFGYRELFNTFQSLRERDETNYSLLINTWVQVPILGRLELPLRKDGTFPVVKVPKISLENLSLKSLSLTKADLVVDLNIQNPNGFDLNVSDLDYQLDLNGVSPISGTIDRSLELTQNSASTIQLPVSLNLLDLGSAVRDILINRENISFSFSGSSTVGSSLPIFEPSSFNFEREGTLNILR